jgi:hypothetical protein
MLPKRRRAGVEDSTKNHWIEIQTRIKDSDKVDLTWDPLLAGASTTAFICSK